MPSSHHVLSPTSDDLVADRNRGAHVIASKDAHSLALADTAVRTLFGEHLWEWNVQENIFLFTPTFPKILAYDEGIWGAHIDEWFSRIHPDDLKQTMFVLRSCIKLAPDQFLNEHRILCRDGSWKHIRVRGLVVEKNDDGQAIRIQGSVLDLSEQFEQKGQISPNNLASANSVRSTFSASLPKVFFYQFQRYPGGHCALPYASDSIETVYGIRAIEVRDNAALLFASVHPDDIENLRVTMKESALGLHVWHLDYRLQLPQGERSLFGEAYPTKNADGSVLWHGFLVDVSDRKRREKQVRAAEQQLYAAMKFTSLGMFDVNIQTGHGQFSPEYSHVLGLPQDYFNHTEKFWKFFWNESLHPDDLLSLKKAYQEHFQSRGKIPYRAEFRLRAKTGEWRWLLSVGCVVEWDQHDRALRMLGTHIDITERKKYEIEVKHFEDVLRSGRDRYKKLASELEIVFNHTPVGIMLVNNERIIRANPMLAHTFGYRDAREMIGISILSMHDSVDAYQALRNQIGRRLREDAVAEANCPLKRLDGSSFEARLIGRVLPFEQFADTAVWMIEEVPE